MKPPCVSENTIKGWVKSDLSHFRLPHWPITAGFGSTQGIADRLAVGPGGVFCAFECKRGIFRKRTGWGRPAPSSNQEAFMQDVSRMGAYGVIVGPVEGRVFRTMLMCRFPSLWTPDEQEEAVRVAERRQKHLDMIMERGF